MRNIVLAGFIACMVPGTAGADIPKRCGAFIDRVEARAQAVDNKLFEVAITLKHGYGKSPTLTNANALIERLGEHVTLTGELNAAVSALIECVSEDG